MLVRANAIDDHTACGDAFPIWQSLAVQGVAGAQDYWGTVYTDEREAICSPAVGLAWYRRAIARGSHLALYNLAISYRNQGNLAGYRIWLAKAARFDADFRLELRQFRTRFPHAVMRRWRRYKKER